MRFSSSGEMWSNRKILVSLYFFNFFSSHHHAACSYKIWIFLLLHSPFPWGPFSANEWHFQDSILVQKQWFNEYFCTFRVSITLLLLHFWEMISIVHKQQPENRDQNCCQVCPSQELRNETWQRNRVSNEPSRRLHEVLESRRRPLLEP